MIRLPVLVSVCGLAAFVVLPIFACSTTVINAAPAGDGGATDEASMDDAGDQDAKSDVGVDAGPFIQATHPAYPQVPHAGTGILNGMKLVTISAPGDPNAPAYAGFGSALVASRWYAAVAADYGLGSASSAGAFTGASLAGTPSLTSGEMENYIANAISGTPAAAADGHHMYILYLPPGTGEATDPMCSQFGGYHQSYGGLGDGWGFVQHCANPPGLSQLQWMTTAGSHEIIEAATDTGTGWAFQGQSDPTTTVWATLLSEVGDLCVGTQIAEGLYTYQRVWMNSLAAGKGDPCGPTTTKPYYNTAPPAGVGGRGWFPVAAGGSAALPITGFSTARIPDWVVAAQVARAVCSPSCAASDFTVTVTSPAMTNIAGKSYPAMNNGITGTLTVTANASVASGSVAEIEIVSEPIGSSGSDPYHVWPVGVYVP